MKTNKIICDILGIMVEYNVDQIYREGSYHLTIHQVTDIVSGKVHEQYQGLRTKIVNMIEISRGIRIYNILD